MRFDRMFWENRYRTDKKSEKSTAKRSSLGKKALKLHTDHVTSAYRCHKIGISQEGSLQCATKGNPTAFAASIDIIPHPERFVNIQ